MENVSSRSYDIKQGMALKGNKVILMKNMGIVSLSWSF